MANLPAVNGKLTKLSVSADGTTFTEICIFGDLTIDFGNQALNKEWCIGSETPYVSLGNNEFADLTYVTPWAEDATTAVGVGIIETAKESKTIAGSTIHVQVEMNNATDPAKKGTLYDYEAVIGGYKILAASEGVVKSEFTMAQSTIPVNTTAEV